MKKIKVIIVDDEPFARARIRKLLESVEYVHIIGEGKNGREARQLIADYAPDLAFLDIQMPDLNGFEVLKEEKVVLPFIIFVTAHNQYALQAFDVHAIDYLLKPFDDERFMQALEHAHKQIQLKDNTLLHQKMIQLLETHQHQQTEELTAFEIKEKGKTKLVKVQDIYWLEAQGNYLKIHVASGKYLIRQTLQSLEEQLDQQVFLRVHRSIIVNANYVQHIQYEGNNQYLFVLKNEDRITSSRSYKPTVQSYLEAQELKKEW